MVRENHWIVMVGGGEGLAHLSGHDGVCGYMFDFADGASISGAQVFDDFKIIWTQI